MKGKSGFTLIELVTVIAIIGIVAALAVPNMISWMNSAKLNGAVCTLTGDLSVAKQSAIRNNASVVVQFSANGYMIFIDDGSGGGVSLNATRDGNESILRQRTLPAGVSIELGSSTFSDDMTRFNGNGRCDTGYTGTVVFSMGGDQSSVSVNRLGRVLLSS